MLNPSFCHGRRRTQIYRAQIELCSSEHALVCLPGEGRIAREKERERRGERSEALDLSICHLSVAVRFCVIETLLEGRKASAGYKEGMETSLRYGSGEKQLLLHAKENFLLDKSFYLQIHGKLNTHTGAASGVTQVKKKFFPELLTSLDVGAKFDSKPYEFTYDVQGKKTLPLTDNGLLSIDLKGGYNFNPATKVGKPRGVVELSYKIFNFTEDQDLKIKAGYNLVNKKPYFQIRENNWTLNADVAGYWSVIYDL